MKNRIAAALFAATALAAPAMAQRAPATVAIVINTDRIYRDCNACRTAQTQLQSQVTALRTRQQTLETQLRPEGQAIQTAVSALAGKQPDAALQNRVKAFQQKQDQANQDRRTQSALPSTSQRRSSDQRTAPAGDQPGHDPEGRQPCRR